MDQQNQIVMTIELGLTRQPAPYQSVRAGVSLPVVVEPGQDVQELLRLHAELALATIRAQIDDEFEQGHGEPAVYSHERRFALLVAHEAKVIVVLPVEIAKYEASLGNGWYAETQKKYSGHRLDYILKRVMLEYRGYQLVSILDGDLSKLPPLERFTLWTYKPDAYLKHPDDVRMMVLAMWGADDWGRAAYPGYWSSQTYFRLYEPALLDELVAKAVKEKALFFDCSDGDFGQVPGPVNVEAPEPEPDPFDDDREDDDDDEDYNDDDD